MSETTVIDGTNNASAARGVVRLFRNIVRGDIEHLREEMEYTGHHPEDKFLDDALNVEVPFAVYAARDALRQSWFEYRAFMHKYYRRKEFGLL